MKYNIEIVDNTGRFNIIVSRVDDPSDRDYLSISQISKLFSELSEYLTTNLKIYLTSQKRISYLALSDNCNVSTEKV